MKNFLATLRMDLLDEETNKRIVRQCVYTVLGFVSFFMTLLNIVTNKGSLTYATGIFAGLCALNVLLVFLGKKASNFSTYLFSIEILTLFTYFVVSGNPDGFSSIWLCMLPSLGMLFYGRGRGSLLSGGMFAILVYILWIPSGRELLRYQYSETFRMRFPVLFFSFYLVAMFLETLRIYTYNEMKRMQELYREQAIRDSLTGIYNRQGVYTAVNDFLDGTDPKSIGAVMFDLDHFKRVNDTYGHLIGDKVLTEFTHLLEANLHGCCARWGGEEFLCIYYDDNVTHDDLENFRRLIESHTFSFDGVEAHITVSIGICACDRKNFTTVDRIVIMADNAMYEAKQTGRNRIVSMECPPLTTV